MLYPAAICRSATSEERGACSLLSQEGRGALSVSLLRPSCLPGATREWQAACYGLQQSAIGASNTAPLFGIRRSVMALTVGINGKEQGNINTPLELAIRNQTDRFSLAGSRASASPAPVFARPY